LFHNKWTSHEGSAVVDGKPTPGFLVWCEKLEGLTGQQIKMGIEALEARLERASQADKEIWPPSYAEFKGLCLMSKHPDGRDIEWSENWQKWYKRDELLAIENKTAKEELAARNSKRAKALLCQLNSPGQLL